MTKGGPADFIAHGRADGRQLIESVRPASGQFDILAHVPCNERLVSGGGQMARRVASRKRRPRASDYGAAHPQGFTRREATRIRLGIEGQVHTMIAGEQLMMWRPALEQDSLRFPSPPGKLRTPTALAGR